MTQSIRIWATNLELLPLYGRVDAVCDPREAKTWKSNFIIEYNVDVVTTENSACCVCSQSRVGQERLLDLQLTYLYSDGYRAKTGLITMRSTLAPEEDASRKPRVFTEFGTPSLI
jgi:hypothetical protein